MPERVGPKGVTYVLYKLAIPQTVALHAFEEALQPDPRRQSNFFRDVRDSLRHEIASAWSEQGFEADATAALRSEQYLNRENEVALDPLVAPGGRELDLSFCRRYGHDDYSTTAINYLHGRAATEIPSLRSFLRAGFAVGNLAILVQNTDDTVTVAPADGVYLAGYTYEISARKRKSYVGLLGLAFENVLLSPLTEKHIPNCTCPDGVLDEVRVDALRYPLVFVCRRCGQLWTCTCFDEYLHQRGGIEGLGPREDVAQVFSELRARPNLCHLCTGGTPAYLYGSVYHSGFRRRFEPYYQLFLRRRGQQCQVLPKDTSDAIENEVREAFGYPRIGEQYISETMLLRIVEGAVSPLEVVHHYRGCELQGLEIDIWVPELSLGIEYQGEQHYEVIEHWGGEEGLADRRERDRRKRELCRTLGYTLLEVKYDEELTTELVERRLAPHLPDEPSEQ